MGLAPSEGTRRFRWWPRLTPEQEQQFQRERREREHILARRNTLLAGVLCAAFAIPDASALTDLVPVAMVLRLGVLVPLILLCYPIRVIGRRLGHPLMEELPQPLAAVAIQAVATVLMIMTRSPTAVVYGMGSILVMVGFAMILHVRLRLAIVALTTIAALGVVGVVKSPIFSQTWTAAIVDVVVVTLLLSMVMIVTREVDWRRTFLLRAQLADLLSAREGDLAALQDANAKLAELTELDELTRLPNRRALQVRLDQWDAQGRWGVFAMVDVDHFKLVNDVHGHAAGDACLRRVGQVLQQRVRDDGGFLARYGGEEFTLVLPAADETAAAAVTERLRAAVEAADVDGLAVTVSIGWASCEAAEPLESTQLLRRADEAVLAAKAAGRNRVVQWGLPSGRPASVDVLAAVDGQARTVDEPGLL